MIRSRYSWYDISLTIRSIWNEVEGGAMRLVTKGQETSFESLKLLSKIFFEQERYHSTNLINP